MHGTSPSGSTARVRAGGLFVRLERFFRYSGVSVMNVVSGQVILTFFVRVLAWGGVASNLSATAINCVPAYFLSKRLVWQHRGPARFKAEMAPFWGIAFVGLAVSTLFVHFAEQIWAAKVMINLASILGFGVVWVGKYFVLDRYLFNSEHPELSAQVEPVTVGQ
ncbi:MAG: GtrA family protein [Acidimicrobiales bacterium]